MKIIVKTLSGKQLPLEIQPEWTVRKVKEQIEAEHQLPADTLKLIAYGKVLEADEKTAADYNIKEGDFIVAMQQKAKPAPKAKPAEEAKQEEPVAAATTSPATTAPVTVPVAQPQPTTQAQAQPAAQQQLPPEVEAAIGELMAISGKPRDLCIRALAAAQNIPDVAFEFLMSGYIPEMPEGGAEGDGGEDGGYGDEDMDDGEEGSNPLANYNLDPQTMQQIQALVSNPSFPMIRQRMMQDPNFSAQFMQQLQQTQPGIFNAIQQNPGILMSLILGHDPMAGMGGGAAHGGHAGHGGQHRQPPPGSIQVTPQEMEAIDRLASLGFPKARCAEAYFACDKNEEMAANFLFEAGMEDEDVATQNAIAASQQEMIGQQQQQPAAQQQQNQANPGNNNGQQNNNNGNNDNNPDAGAGGDGSSLA